MAFNFGISSESAVRTVRRQLAPWNIYDVKFIGCEIVEGTKKDDPSIHWKRLDVKFENEDGYFNMPLWWPKDGDDQRRTTTGANGGEVTFPSNFEVLMAKISQTGQVLNPTGFEKMQAASAKFKSFDDVANALIKITNLVKGKETKLKLIGKKNKDGKIVAEVPKIVAINKDGDSFISDNYIGDKLFFSEYEEGQRQAYLNTKPTTMPKEDVVSNTIGIDSVPSEDFDLESLL